jgi:hypothetical protein
MKKIISFVLFVAICGSLVAQNRNVQVFLKNGGIVKGKLHDSVASDRIKVESNNTIWVFKDSEVDTVLEGSAKKIFNTIDMPYFIDAEYGVLSGNSNNEENSVSFLHGSFNYRFATKFYAGVGSGAEYYMEQSYIPVFAKLEYRFRPTKFSPHFFIKAGYLIPGEKQQPSDIYQQYESRNIPPKYLNASGGVAVNPGIGFTSLLGENFGLRFSLGYRYHVLNFSGKGQYELEQRYNRLSFSLGIIFK